MQLSPHAIIRNMSSKNNKVKLNLKELQAELASILSDTADFLKKNRIDFWLNSGTLLGAVRHKGFIPWDDDVDIITTREGYKKLQKFVEKNGKIITNSAGKDLEICMPGDKGYIYPFPKIIDRSVEIVSQNSKDNYAWVDIFILDPVPESRNTFYPISEKARKYRNLIHAKYTKTADILKEHRSLPNRLAKIFIKVPLLFTSGQRISQKITALADIYQPKEAYYYTDLMWGCEKMPLRYRKSQFDKTIMLEFEGKKYPAPAGYDEQLGFLYGDYMKLPPKSEQITHGCKAYRVDKKN